MFVNTSDVEQIGQWNRDVRGMGFPVGNKTLTGISANRNEISRANGTRRETR